MLILGSPGQLVGTIECKSCFRRVRVDPRSLPPAPIAESFRRRLRCKVCGGKGAYIRIVWTIPPAARSSATVFLEPNPYTPLASP